MPPTSPDIARAGDVAREGGAATAGKLQFGAAGDGDRVAGLAKALASILSWPPLMATVLPVARLGARLHAAEIEQAGAAPWSGAPATLAVPWVIVLDRVEFQIVAESPIVSVTPAPL